MVALMGLGKSYLFTRLLCALGRTTLIVVTKEDLMKQWKDNLLKYTDIKEEDIGIIRQGICQVKGKKVVIGLVHSLSCREYPDYIYSYFGLVACDEAHRMSCDYFSEVMFKFNSYLRIALTATPHRPDGKSFVFKAHIGEVLSSSDHVQISPKVLVVRTNWKLPKWKVKDEFTGLYKMVDMTVPKGKPAVVSKHMAISETRNNLLVDLCFKAYNKDRKIVMFFDSLKHIEIIKMKLLALGIPPAEILKYVGGIKKADVEAVHTKRILLATYTYMSEGTDVPFLDTAILCSPRSNVSQAVGRILRKVEGKKEPVIMDVIDPCSKDIMESFESRVRQYKKLNAIIVDVS
jgi:superfamily II DNA or RNA helicase